MLVIHVLSRFQLVFVLFVSFFFSLFQKASIILQDLLLKVILLLINWRINLINLQLWEYFNFAFRLNLKMMFSFYFLYILCLY